jgi:hypothetical protein
MIPLWLQFFEEKIEQMKRNNQIRYYYISHFNINLLKLVPMEKRGWEGKIYLIVDYLAL